MVSGTTLHMEYHSGEYYEVRLRTGEKVFREARDLNEAKQALVAHSRMTGMKLSAYVVCVPERYRLGRDEHNDLKDWPNASYPKQRLRA